MSASTTDGRLWSRLPTPAPSDHAGPSSASLLAPPLTAPSTVSKSASQSSIALSVLSSSISLDDDSFPDHRPAHSSSRFISALPSPSISVSGSTYSFPDTLADESSRPASPPGHPSTSGSKTSSFFSTSFAVPPPSLLPQRSTSLSVRGKHADGNGSAYGNLKLAPNHYPQQQQQQQQLANSFAHPRSVSAERERADSANSIFFTNIAAPTPPPPLRSTTLHSASTTDAGPSSPPRRAFDIEEILRDTPRAEPRGEFFSGLGERKRPPPPISPAPRRRIILLDDDAVFHASPAPSPTAAAFADAEEGRETGSDDTPNDARGQPGPVPPPSPPPPPPNEHHAHIHREPASSLSSRVHPAELSPGTTISTPDAPVVSLTLVRLLGKGAFSSVWLCADPLDSLGPCHASATAMGERRRSESVAKRRGDRRMAGISPRLESIVRGDRERERDGSVILDEGDGEGATTPVLRGGAWSGAEERERGGGRVVAVKMLDRAMCEVNDRTRISFVREVEVLRHIHHPSIVSYLHSFTTPTHHCLVLEYLAGGELFSLLDDDEKYGRLTEPLLRRMFGELARAVGWMHGVALVHRDIKLENIILTCDPFAAGGSSPPTLDSLPSPLLKLTDFGLSRFIDVTSPLLQTRCGSESYAAPEIVMGQKYDGRQTDAWACGVVLYALATRALPFDMPESARGQAAEEEEEGVEQGGGRQRRKRGANEGRKAYLFRIAKGDYTWPKESVHATPTPTSTPGPTTNGVEHGPSRSSLATPGLKAVVSRLLVRDPAKRARVVDLWEEEWMKGEGAPNPPHRDRVKAGHLVDGDSIGDVARQELV